MLIGDGVQPLAFRPLVAAGPLSRANEKPLFGSESIDGLQLLVPGGILPGHPREDGSAQVGRVLAQGQLAVDLHVVDYGVLRILVADTGGALDELLAILLGPPVAQVALAVELA